MTEEEAAQRAQLMAALDLLICFASLPELEPLPRRRIPPSTRPTSDVIARAQTVVT